VKIIVVSKRINFHIIDKKAFTIRGIKTSITNYYLSKYDGDIDSEIDNKTKTFCIFFKQQVLLNL
jgi:hypothetical protein